MECFSSAHDNCSKKTLSFDATCYMGLDEWRRSGNLTDLKKWFQRYDQHILFKYVGHIQITWQKE